MGWIIIIGIVVYFLLGQFFLGLIFEDGEERDVPPRMFIFISFLWLPLWFVYIGTRIVSSPYKLAQHLKSKYRQRKQEKTKK